MISPIMDPAQTPEPAVATVLIVDDEAPIRNALRRELKSAGFAVVTCASPKEAIETVGQGIPGLGAAVLDYYMPGMDGVDLAGRLREMLPGLPVLMVTAGYLESDEKVAGALASGVLVEVVTKPWKRAALQESIRRATRALV